MPSLKLFCLDCTSARASSPDPTASEPIPRPPSLTPTFEHLPSIPEFQLDGAFCRPLRARPSVDVRAGPRPAAAAANVEQTAPPATTTPTPTPTPPSPSAAFVEADLPEESLHEDRGERKNRRISVPWLYKKKAFTIPELDMVAGRSPASAWQAVAAKVVAANRFRRGMGREARIEEFKIEELGGRAGPSVFGPVAVFNGNVTMRVKKPLKEATVSVAFHGVTEVNRTLVPFITAESQLYAGDLQAGLRSFLFGFDFPHVNLPPTSDQPLIAYSFSATLSTDGPSDSNGETLSSGHSSASELTEFHTKPFRITFIPSVDPSLETPLMSRKPSMRKKRSREKSGPKKPATSSTHTLDLSPSSSPAIAPITPKVRGPKLTLTTADLPLSASSNSTPVIDKPNPAMLSSAISRSTRITDDDNSTLAKLTIEMPSSRFLPGDDIIIKLTLQVREGVQVPKGLGARVIEIRSLAMESPDGEEPEKEAGVEEEKPLKMKVAGKEQFRVLTGRKQMLRHDELVSIARSDDVPESDVDKTNEATQVQDNGLKGGQELVEMMTVSLPPFQTFITDSLLPTATLPLGDPRSDEELLDLPSPSSTVPKIVVNGKGKSPASTAGSTGAASQAKGFYFKVSHHVQVTVPMSGHQAGYWFKSSSSLSLDDLEVTVPIIIGNKNPNQDVQHKTPQLRLNAPDMGRKMFGSGEGSSMLSSRSNSRSSSSGEGGGSMAVHKEGAVWREGDKFLTLRDTEVRPAFVGDR